MGRPLKIQKYSTGSGNGGAGVAIDQGFPQFANLDPNTQVIPSGMISSEFLGVVGGSNTSVATSSFPVVAITANVNGQQGAAHIITQKGSHKYLVAGEDTVTAGSFTVGFSYQIISLGDTNWTVIGAGINPTVGQVFTATGVGAGTGTASDAGQCQLVTTNTINSGQMYMTFVVDGAPLYASKLTNKYIFDSSNNRYATNFFVAGSANPTTLVNVGITGNAGTFSCSNTTIANSEPILVTGTLSGNATGSITGYTNPTTYFVTNTNGVNTFTLASTLGGANIITSTGNTLGLTFSIPAVTTAKSGADTVTWTGNNGNLTVAKVSSYTS